MPPAPDTLSPEPGHPTATGSERRPDGGWIDLTGRTQLRVHGADRQRFLNGQLTNDLRRLPAGEALYACVLTAKGKLCADVFVRAEPDFYQLDADPNLREDLVARLERYLVADDVEIRDVTGEFSLLHLVGPGADETARAATSRLALPAGRAWRFGVPGWDLVVTAPQREPLREWLTAAEARRELAPADVEILRVTAGIPRWGAELGPDVLPAEAGLEARAVDFSKGCYVGQEVVSRLKSVGRVNRLLRLLRVDLPAGAPVPVPGAVLRAPGEGSPADPGLGALTSVVTLPEPAGGAVIALGYVRRGHDAPGTRLQVAGEGSTTVEVVR